MTTKVFLVRNITNESDNFMIMNLEAFDNFMEKVIEFKNYDSSEFEPIFKSVLLRKSLTSFYIRFKGTTYMVNTTQAELKA